MTHTQTKRGRNQIKADLRLPQTTPVLLFDENRNKHKWSHHNKSLHKTGPLNASIATLINYEVDYCFYMADICFYSPKSATKKILGIVNTQKFIYNPSLRIVVVSSLR